MTEPAVFDGNRGRPTFAWGGAVLCATLLAATGSSGANGNSSAPDPSKTTYGTLSSRAPAELQVFSFLIGKWDGKGSTRLQDGKIAEFPVSWVGRYILDGTAIADELHAAAPDGSPYLGITFRQYDRKLKTWTIEYLNVPGSFLRKQVNGTAGAVSVEGRDVTVASESPGVKIQEHYLVPDNDHFTYRLDVSNDGGNSWVQGQIEMTFQRQAP